MESLFQHLRNVYLCLVLSTIVAGISVVSTAFFFNSFLYYTLISAIGSGVLFLLLIVSSDQCNANKEWRTVFLLGFAGFSGMGVTDLVKGVIKEKPTILVDTLINTLTIFICLSAIAFFTDEERWIYLGTPLTCTLITVLIISFANVFEKSDAVSRSLVYLSLVTICGLVLYDTQMTMLRFKQGDKDVIRRALSMFTDFFGIYRRLLILAVDKQKQGRSLDTSILSDEHDLQILGSVPFIVPVNNLS